jgi:type 1 glutamine amidotransferase
MRTTFLIMSLTLTLLALLTTPPATRAQQPPAPTAKISVLIVDGMNNHDWARATLILKQILELTNKFSVEVSTSPKPDAPNADWQNWRPQFSKYQVVINNFNGGYKATDKRWSPALEKDLEDYVKSGGGLVVYHAANNAFRDWPAYNDMIGLGWRDQNFGPSLIIDKNEKITEIPTGQGLKPGHGPEHDFVVTTLTTDHPITQGLPKKWLHPHEQLTHGQHGPAKNMTILSYAWSKDTNENEPMDWVIPYGKGRVYTTMLGHLWKDKTDITLNCAGFRTLFTRGVEWAATGNVTLPIPEDFPTESKIITRPPLAPPPTTQPTPK